MTDGLLKREEAAAWLGVGLRTLDKWQAEGVLPHVRHGSRFVRFRLEDLRSFAAERVVSAETVRGR